MAWLRRRPLVTMAAVLAGLILWNLQFEYIFNSEMLAGKGGAVTLDRLADAQVETLYRRVLRVPAWAVRPGFNEVALLFSTSPREASPDHHGKDAAAAVDFLRWTREGRP